MYFDRNNEEIHYFKNSEKQQTQALKIAREKVHCKIENIFYQAYQFVIPSLLPSKPETPIYILNKY